MIKSGYNNFCVLMNRLNVLVAVNKELTPSKISKIYNKCFDEQGNEKHNLQMEIDRETCELAKRLIDITKFTKIDDIAFDIINDRKEYIYNTYFKPYEPKVETIDEPVGEFNFDFKF